MTRFYISVLLVVIAASFLAGYFYSQRKGGKTGNANTPVFVVDEGSNEKTKEGSAMPVGRRDGARDLRVLPGRKRTDDRSRRGDHADDTCVRPEVRG